MKNKIILDNVKKEKIKVFLIILLLAVITCIMFLNFHKITDTYWNIEEGYNLYKITPLKDGRIVYFILLNIAECINIPMVVLFVLSMISATIINSLSVYKIYQYIINNKNLKWNSNIKYKAILVMGSFLIIYNPMTVELYAYMENVIMSLGILLCTIAAITLDCGNKKNIIKSILLMIIAGLCYQGILNIFISISLLLFIMKDNKKVADWVKYICKIAFIVIITLAILLITINLSNQVINEEQSRINMLINMLKVPEIIKLAILSIVELNYNLFSELLMRFSILFTIIMIMFCSKKRIKNLSEYFIAIIIIILACVVPVYFQKVIAISARMTIAIGSIIGISIIYMGTIAIKNESNKIKINIINVFAVSMILINTYNYINLGFMNVITNIEEEKICKNINQKIENYESENNIKIKYVAFCEDKNYKDTYKDLPMNSFTIKALGRAYSDDHCLNYFNKSNLTKVKIDSQNYEKYFKDKDWNEFNEEQIQFDGDIVMICLY